MTDRVVGAAPFARINVKLALGLAFLVLTSLMMASLVRFQPAGVDFVPIWLGAKIAVLTDGSRLYDFKYLTDLQGWPLGFHAYRPFLYPPPALLLFAPLTPLPWVVAYAIWIAGSGALFLIAGRRLGAPWWLIFAPWVVFSAYCGQVTMFIGALVFLGLSERKTRPLLAGLLFGLAASIKPQVLILLPFALVAERNWHAILATGATGAALCGTSAAVFGLDLWFDWAAAMPRFADLAYSDERLVSNMISPAPALHHFSLDARLAMVLAPLSVWLIWRAFRREWPLEDQLIILLAATAMISPYAMNYELAMFAPAVAIYLARTDDRAWAGYLAAIVIAAVAWHPAVLSLLGILALPLIRRIGRPGQAHGTASPL